MQRIINFILNYRNAFLYGLLLVFCLAMTIRSHSYHQSKFFNSSKLLTGSILSTKSAVSDYFRLKEENQQLAQENERLRLLLFNAKNNTVGINSEPIYEVIHARIIKNMFSSPRNYITINKGLKDGVQQDMGVITPSGILGIVENTSNNYATVQSILNTRSNINAKIKNTDYFGSLKWDAEDYDVVQLVDIPRSATVTVGDTISTGAMSSIFPEDIPIGVIKKYDLNQNQSSYNIQVDLFNDMANVKNVYIIKNRDKEEILELQKSTENVE
ncbi:MAG: rod shape-determining protein MreC [Bacteroidota bacterium]